MGGESGADVKDGVLPGLQLGTLQDAGHTPLHGTHRGYDTLGIYVNVYESLDKAGGVLLELRNALHGRIDGRDTRIQGLFLRLDADGAGRDARHAELQVRKAFSGDLLQGRSHHGALPDGGPGNVVDAHFPELPVKRFFGNWKFHLICGFGKKPGLRQRP